MRKARKDLLNEDHGIIHKYWRCHNREFYLGRTETKNLYLDCLSDALKTKLSEKNVSLHSFAIMNNHAHQQLSFNNGIEHLSKYMHKAHSKFGRKFNDQNNRSGKFADDRPHTPPVNGIHQCLILQFYIEANPLRAKICNLEQLHEYKYSSYGFYAHGVRTLFTENLVIPDWYLDLGKTPKQRQRRYRKLFKEYLDAAIPSDYFHKKRIDVKPWDKWIEKRKKEFKKKFTSKQEELKSSAPP